MLRDPQRPFAPPSDATEVLLVRHGSAGGPAAGEPPELVGGHTDVPLSALGHAQARALVARLASVALSGIFVTTLRRTAETAAPLAAATGLQPIVVPELREVFLGDWEGGEFHVRMERGDPMMVEVFARQRWDVIPNAEPAETFAARVRQGLEEVASTTGPGAAAVAVVHGGVVAEACRQVTDSEPFAFINVDNASITRLVRLASGRWLLLSFNDTAHLADLAVGSPDNAAVRTAPVVRDPG
jgi:probable phosphoglycerate mutase